MKNQLVDWIQLPEGTRFRFPDDSENQTFIVKWGESNRKVFVNTKTYDIFAHEDTKVVRL